jgi:hypothetical protein
MVVLKKSTSRLAKMFHNASTPDLRESAAERRAVSQHPPLPDRSISENAPWTPPLPSPQMQQRAVSAQVPQIETSQRFFRKPFSYDRRAVSASSSPVNRSPVNRSPVNVSPVNAYPANGLYSIPSNAPAVQPVNGSVQTLPVPGALAEPTSTAKRVRRRSWFGGGGAKLSKASKEEVRESPGSWILGHGDQRPAYDATALLGAERVRFTVSLEDRG